MVAGHRRARGEGEPITTQKRLRATGDVTYLPETDEVRIVTTRDGTGSVTETVEPVAEWLRRECPIAAAEAVRPVVDDRLAAPTERVRTGVQFDCEPGPAITVTSSISLDRDGTVIATPNVRFDELVGVTPRTVDSTVAFDDRERTCEVPVFVERTTRHRV